MVIYGGFVVFLCSTNNTRNYRAIKKKLAEGRRRKIDHFQDNFGNKARDSLAILNGVTNEVIACLEESVAVSENVRDVFNGFGASWREEAKSSLVLGPMATETFGLETS